MGLFGFALGKPKKYLSDKSYQASLALQLGMTPQTIAQLRANGIDAGKWLPLEFFFYTNAVVKANMLDAALTAMGYRVSQPESKNSLKCVTGWTKPMQMTDAGVLAWTQRMCELGHANDCQFDGWDANPAGTPAFSAATLHLLRELGQEAPLPQNDEQAGDPAMIETAVLTWHARLRNAMGAHDYSKGLWPSSSDLRRAMRAVLAEQHGKPAGDVLAYSLIRCGCKMPDTQAALHAYDAQLFRWRTSKVRAQDLFSRFQAIGAAGQAEPEDLQRLNDWIFDPPAALGCYDSSELGETLFKGRVFRAGLYDKDGAPEYALMFELMARHAAPALAVAKVSQAALEGGWQVAFELDGSLHRIDVEGGTVWLNDTALIERFDAVLAAQGRRERVIKFAPGREDRSGHWGNYIIAEPGPFRALCAEVGIPLMA